MNPQLELEASVNSGLLEIPALDLSSNICRHHN